MATGDTLISWQATGAHFPTSNAATFDTTAAGLPVLDFDDAADETAYFAGVMPGQYDGSTAITVVIGWKLTTAGSSQTVEFEVSFGRIADDADSVDSYTFAAAQTLVATEPSATGELDYASVNFTNAQADGIQGNEFVILKVMRDSSEQTASPGDAELAFVEVKLQ